MVLDIIVAVVSVYMLILSLRILLSWFRVPALDPATRILSVITDPYLGLFRRIRFLKTEKFDFTPVLAILVLVVISNILDSLAFYGSVSAGLVVSIVVSALWSAVSFILLFFLVLVVARLVAVLAGSNSVRPIWRSIDLVIQPLMYTCVKVFKRPLTYLAGLLFTGGLLFVAWLGGRFLVQGLVRLLSGL